MYRWWKLAPILNNKAKSSQQSNGIANAATDSDICYKLNYFKVKGATYIFFITSTS